jgi:hypothetical protein
MVNQAEMDNLTSQALQELQSISDVKALEDFRVKYFGKKGLITQARSAIGKTSPEERATVGKIVNQVAVTVESALKERQEQIGTSAKPSGSPTYPLDVFAAVSADKKTMTISVINPTETAQECDLKLSGMQAAGSGKVWRITAPAGAAPGGRGAGGAPATMEEKAGQDASAKISVPAASISIYEFPVK